MQNEQLEQHDTPIDKVDNGKTPMKKRKRASWQRGLLKKKKRRNLSNSQLQVRESVMCLLFYPQKFNVQDWKAVTVLSYDSLLFFLQQLEKGELSSGDESKENETEPQPDKPIRISDIHKIRTPVTPDKFKRTDPTASLSINCDTPSPQKTSPAKMLQ